MAQLTPPYHIGPRQLQPVTLGGQQVECSMWMDTPVRVAEKRLWQRMAEPSAFVFVFVFLYLYLCK